MASNRDNCEELKASQEAPDFFSKPIQKKDSTVSLSENDANSPKQFASVDPAKVGANQGGLDFAKQSEDDFFDPLEIPVQKRSLSNGDSFFQKEKQAQEDEAVSSDAAYRGKLAATASDPNSSGQQSSNSHEARAALRDSCKRGPSE